MKNSNAFFITGTDTEIGKTTIASALLHATHNTYQYSTLACKPVASGCAQTPEGLRNDDALALAAQCSIAIPYTELNPYAFEPAIAPHIAAAQLQQNLNLNVLHTAVQRVLAYRADFTVIEGAGGWHVPLNEEERLSDLVVRLQLPVILVVGIRLGCINHALLTAESIQRQGLTLAGWVANAVVPESKASHANIHYLRSHLSAPCLGHVPYLPNGEPTDIATYLNLSALLKDLHQ